MINLELSDDILNWHKNYIIKSDIKDKLIKINTKVLENDEPDFIKYMIKQVEMLDDAKTCKESIFLKKPEELKSEIEMIKSIYPTTYKNCRDAKPIRSLILDNLGYESFIDKRPGLKKNVPTNWSPYTFTSLLGLKVCPYCNRAYINTYYSTDGKTRPDLDHFLPKSLYPYLSMSIYNFVPSCKVCNEGLKGKHEFSFDDNISPYEEKMKENLMLFSYDPKVFPGMIGLKESDMSVKIVYDERNPDYKRLKNNCDVFKIEQLYQNHKDLVCDMLKRNYIHNKEYRDSLEKMFPGLFNSRDEIDRFLLGVADEDDIKNSVLGKLKWDIYSEINGD